AQLRLQRVVCRVCNWRHGEQAAENWDTIGWASRPGRGFAQGRGIPAQSDQGDRVGIGTSHAWHRTIRQMQRDAGGNGTGRNRIGGVFAKWPTRDSRDLVQVEASPSVTKVLIQTGEQPMTLAANVPDLQHHISRELPLDREVILLGVLTSQGIGEVPKQENRTEERKIYRGARNWVRKPVKRIRSYSPALPEKRRVEKGIADEC